MYSWSYELGVIKSVLIVQCYAVNGIIDVLFYHWPGVKQTHNYLAQRAEGTEEFNYQETRTE